MSRQRLRWLLHAAFWSGIFGVSYLALSPLPGREIVTGWDKTNHLLAFSVLAALGLRSWPERAGRVLTGLAIHGCCIEVLQSFTPDRVAGWQDIVANLLGLLLGWGAISVLGHRGR